MRRMASGTRFSAVVVLLLCVSSLVGTARAEEDPAADHYFRGNALYNRNMHALAIEEYKLFLKEHPTHAKGEHARYGMALCYYALGKHADAEPLLKALVAKGQVGDKEQLALLRGQCLLDLDKPADAEAVFTSVSRSKSADNARNAIAGILEAQYRQDDWANCVISADRLLKAGATGDYLKRALYQAAHACHKLETFAQALPYLEKLQPLVQDDPMAPQVAFMLAESYRKTDKLAEAAETYTAAVGGFEGAVAAEVYYRLGFVQFAQAKYDEAIAAFDKSLRAKNDGEYAAEAQFYLGRSWLEKRDFKKAMVCLEPLSGQTSPKQATTRSWVRGPLAVAKPSARGALWFGRTYSRQKKYGEAATFLARAIHTFRTSPLLPDLLFDHANALMVEGKFAEAAASLARILPYKDWPQINDAMRLHAVCLHRAGDYKNSLTFADAFIARFKSDPLASEAFFVRSENLYFLGQMDDATKGYSLFVTTYPTNASVGAATFRIGQIDHKKGLWAKAAGVIAPLVAQQPEGKVYSQLNFIAGDCNFRLEQWDQAVSNLTVFVEQHNTPLPRDRRQPRPPSPEPNFDSALIELSLAYVNLNNSKAAMDTLPRIVREYEKSVHRPLAMSELGRLQYEAEDLKGAKQTLSDFVTQYAKHPQRPKVEYYLGWVALKEEQEAAAEPHFGIVANSYPKDSLGPDAALQLGLVQVSLEKFSEARNTFARLIKTYPEHPRMDLAVFSFGVANARLKRWAEAASFFRKVAEEFPKSEIADRAVYEWAWCEKGLKKNEAAVERYAYLLKTYPQSELRHKATTEMAELTYGAGKFDEAIGQLTNTLARLSDPTVKEQTLYRLGTAYYNKGDFESSAKTFEDFVKLYSKSALLGSALFQAGESRMKVKELKLAGNHFLAASRITSLPPSLKESVLLRLAEVQGLTRQWHPSINSYRLLLTTFPESQWARNAHFGIAWGLEKVNQFPQAMVEYKLVIDPKAKDLLSARAQFQIAECLFAQKKYDEAIRELVPVQVSYRYKDWAAKALLETGRIMEAKGDTTGAIAQFREVIKKFPGDNAAVVAKGRLDVLRREQ